jgi:hypothetical protein
VACDRAAVQHVSRVIDCAVRNKWESVVPAVKNNKESVGKVRYCLHIRVICFVMS